MNIFWSLWPSFPQWTVGESIHIVVGGLVLTGICVYIVQLIRKDDSEED